MNYNFDKQVSDADELRDDWKRDPIFYFKPNPGGQTDVWNCTKQNQIILGGNRCLGGETLIYDPVLGRETPVCEIKDNFHVLAWDGKKLVIAEASKPFIKGVDKLYKVKLASGETFVCSKHHRILTRHGVFQPLFDIERGCDVFSPQRHNYSRITDIDFIRKDIIWDFEVYKYHNYFSCGTIHHNSGKTRVLFTKACAFMVPHPQDKNYAFWPDDLALRRQGLRIKLPVEIWISKRSYIDHQDVTMKYLWRGFEGKKDIPPLLKGRIRNMQFSPNFPDVWHYAETNEGSRVTLKSEAAGKRSYEGAAVFAVIFDEPCDPEIYKEGKMRVTDMHGYTLYGLTGAMAHDGDPSVWRNVVYVKEQLLPLGNTDFQEIIYIPTIENPFIDYDFQVGQTEGMSGEEKLVRLTGQIQVATGSCFFNLDDLGFLRRTAIEPKFTGTLEENFKEQITDAMTSTKNWAVYLTEKATPAFPLRIYHYPERGRQYAIGADVGGGGDPSAVVVIDDEWKICALQHGHIDEISLAIELSKLGRFYHNAWIAPEVNFPGNVTASWLWQGNSDLGLHRYNKIFRRTKSKYEKRGQLYIPGSDIGWLTTGGQQGSRSELLAGLRELIIRAKREADEDFILIPCGKFLDECSTFCLHPDGKYEALSGSHDDIIIATGIAIQCLKTYVLKKRKIQSQPRQPQPVYSFNERGQIQINFGEIIERRMENDSDNISRNF